MKYYPRLVDSRIDQLNEAFNAINIVGPKGCGKTRTAKERCKTIIEFQDEIQDQNGIDNRCPELGKEFLRYVFVK